METDVRRSLSIRANRRIDRNNQTQQTKVPQDVPIRIIWKRGFVRLVIVGGILWILLILAAVSFQVWSCQSSVAFISVICSKESKVFTMMDNMGLVPKQHRCPIPLLDNPDTVVIPESSTPNTIPQKLSYILEDEHARTEPQSPPLFGGHQSWKQREESFKLKPTMRVCFGVLQVTTNLNIFGRVDGYPFSYGFRAAKKSEITVDTGLPKSTLVIATDNDLRRKRWNSGGFQFLIVPDTGIRSHSVHCGFVRNGGAEMDAIDVKYAKKCKFVVASGIFDGYDTPHQPSNISLRSQKLFCFLMVVDEKSLDFIRHNVSVKIDSDGGKWVGIWRLVVLHHPPYDEPRRNGKVPKILTHRLFPQAQYSIWIDGKMELIVDPLLILERYLWRGKNTFAIACHKHHRSIYEEADAIKRRKRYARPLIDLQMKIYHYEGMEPWNPMKRTASDVPEGAVIIQEHTPLNNLFSCLWFNEVNLFTPRDQLSFGYVVYRLGESFKFFMFPNCEYNSLFILHRHTREHSSVVEWVKSLDEFKRKTTGLKESRGGLGLWTPYPGDLDSVELPSVQRTSQAG